jgi:UDP-3-O-[3-hydroxymyristoyl] glucosamine N-acyltransferase
MNLDAQRQQGIDTSVYIHESAIIEDGVQIGAGTKIWHQCHIRKGAIIGANCVLGKGVFVDFGVQIGNGVKIQNGVSVYHGVTIEDDVFVGPLAVFTNDQFPRAFGGWTPEQVVTTLVRVGASICAGACIRCGVTVGAYAMIGMGAVLTKDAGAYELWLGNPARCQGHVNMQGKRV